MKGLPKAYWFNAVCILANRPRASKEVWSIALTLLCNIHPKSIFFLNSGVGSSCGMHTADDVGDTSASDRHTIFFTSPSTDTYNSDPPTPPRSQQLPDAIAFTRIYNLTVITTILAPITSVV